MPVLPPKLHLYGAAERTSRPARQTSRQKFYRAALPRPMPKKPKPNETVRLNTR
jgi:hypothetical protein